MKLIPIYLVSVILLLFSSCKEDPNSPDPDPTPSDPDLNKYLVSLPKWDIFCPTDPNDDTQGNPTTDWECATQTVQTTALCSITRTPEEIVTYDPGSEILYVGSLIQGKKYIGGLGSIQALPINQRAPIKISIDIQMANNNRTVEHPSLTTVKSAIGDLVVEAQNSGNQTASSISFKYKTSYTVEQLAISLGLSAKFMKGQAKVDLDAGWAHEKEKHTVAGYFIQKMFTVSMEIPQRPGDFFSSEFTKELLDEQISLGRIGPDNLPVYVSNIVYGRTMVFTMTSTHQADSMGLALDARYKNISGQIDAKYQKIIDNSTFTLTTIGGDAQSALNFIRTGQYGSFFEQNPPLTTAVPISYTLRNVGDNVVAKVSETTNYDMVQSGPISVTPYVVKADWQTVGSTMSIKEWLCTQNNVFKADEHNLFQNGGSGQYFLGKHITFDGTNTGYPFDFYLENACATIPQNQKDALVYNDQEANFNPAISIGDIGNWENDDFVIGVSGNAKVYAIAFIMKDNTDFSGEYLEVYAKDKNGEECKIARFTLHINGFFGIISPVPVSRIFFDEDSGGDDIGLGDLYFGYK